MDSSVSAGTLKYADGQFFRTLTGLIFLSEWDPNALKKIK